MADNTKETFVLDFQIQQGDALSELEATKKSIVQLKQQQADLNKEYKDGAKNLDQYTKETVQLEAALKKQTATYSKVQQSVTGLKSPFQQLGEQVKSSAQSVNVAGVSLSNFINPATAAVSIVGLLGKAYASSTVGAKDLEFASNQLSSAMGLLTNSFGEFISSAEDGEGFFSRIANSVISVFSPATAAVSKYLANLKEQLDDVKRDEISVRADISDRLEANAEKLTKIADAQTSFNDKIKLQEEITDNLKTNQEDIVRIKQKEYELLQQVLAADKNNEDKQTAVLQAEKDLNRERGRAEKLIQASVRAMDNLIEAQNKLGGNRTDEKGDITFEKVKEITPFVKEQNDALAETNRSIAQQATEYTKVLSAKIEADKKINESERQKTQIAKLESQNRLDTVSNTLGQASALFEKDSLAYKVLGIARATVDTYRAADLALASIPPPFGAIAAGVNIALGLANVAKIADISMAAGGGSFMTRGPQLLMVGDNPGGVERVDVTPVSGRGKTSVTGNMIQMGDGGSLIAHSQTAAIDRAFSMNNKTFPPVILDYSEFRKFTSSVEFKEQLSTV